MEVAFFICVAFMTGASAACGYIFCTTPDVGAVGMPIAEAGPTYTIKVRRRDNLILVGGGLGIGINRAHVTINNQRFPTLAMIPPIDVDRIAIGVPLSTGDMYIYSNDVDLSDVEDEVDEPPACRQRIGGLNEDESDDE